MRLGRLLLIVFLVIAFITDAQSTPLPVLNIGDPAPPLHVQEWIKGTPIERFEKGQVYVIEFWATWCAPCRAVMPRLSALAHEFKDKVNVICVDIYEQDTTSIRKIRAFVDSMKMQMDFSVVIPDSSVVADWIETTGQKIMGIPTTFVVNKEGQIAWIGHPCDLGDALFEIVNNTWDINAALSKRNLGFRLRDLENSLSDILDFTPNGDFRSDRWEQDSALLQVNEAAKIEPLLKFTPRIAYKLFSLLLKTDMKGAYKYGKEVIITTTFEEPAAYSVIEAIEDLSDKINLSPEIYQLGIDAIQVKIDQEMSCVPEIINIYKSYYRMAEWYYQIGNKRKAIDAQEKAIEGLKSKKNFSTKDLSLYLLKLKRYENM